MAENKGKPSGRVASTKRDPGIKSEIRERSAPSGAYGHEQRDVTTELHPAGQGGPEQNAGGPDHSGADAHEDRNP
jgi:hypothetical protein